MIAASRASASDVKAEFIWALPPAANDNSPFGAIFGGGDEIAGYAPLALVAENGASQLELYWVHGNRLGVPVVTTNVSGQVVTPANDFLAPGFPGQSQVLADLYYNRARDYDPVTGRYIQADPIGLLGDVNPYTYANADPMNMIDPLGLRARGRNPTAGEVADIAIRDWLERQKRPGRATPWGRAWGIGEAIGNTAAAAWFLYNLDDDCDDDDDYCYQRWNREYSNCQNWFYLGFRAVRACRDRASYRRGLCTANGGTPSPSEPPEWDPLVDWYDEPPITP